MKNSKVVATSKGLMPISERPEIVFVKGVGSYLFDTEGRRYLDWLQGWAVNCLGHSPRNLVQALAVQAEALINPSPAFYNRPALDLADLLTSMSCFDHVFFCSSGAEANEGAIKLARKWGRLHKKGAYEIITFGEAFHGRTLATMSASGKAGWDNMFPPQVSGFPKAVLNDIASVRSLVGERTVAVMLEPVQGEAGVFPATQEFMSDLRAFCDQHGLLLIFDEVQTGCGRTGTLFAYEQYGIEPDIMTIGKGLGGGVPLAALLAKSACSCFSAGEQGGTFCGNPLACAVGLEVVRTLLSEGFLEESRKVGQTLKEGLELVSRDFSLGDVRGKGLLLALELGADLASEIVGRAREAGLLINAPRPRCLRFMPALNTTASEIEEGLLVLRQVLEATLSEQGK